MNLVTENSSFKDYIKNELNSADSSLSCEVTNYVADMLSFYLRSDRLHSYQGGSGNEETLVALYGKIHSAKPREKLCLFKKMGDLSLYISGFFRSAVEKKIVDVSYYEDMGQSAYGYLADFYGSRNNVFVLLAGRFKDLAENLFYIQRKSELKDDRNFITLYGDYMSRRKSSVLKRLLQETCVLPDEEI